MIRNVRRRAETFYILQENWDAWQVFVACCTQWKRETVFAMGMKRPVTLWIGLDYTALAAVIDMLGISRESREDIFCQVRLIEHGALKGFHSG